MAGLKTLFQLLPVETRKSVRFALAFSILLSLMEVFSLLFFYEIISLVLGGQVNVFGLSNDGELSIVLAAYIIVVILVAIYSTWFSRFYSILAAKIGINIGDLLMYRVLRGDFEVLSSFSENVLKKELTVETNRLANLVILPIFRAVSRALIFIGFSVFLFLINPLLTLFSLFAGVVIYAFIYYFIRNNLKRNDEKVKQGIESRYTKISDTVSAKRELRVFQIEGRIHDEFVECGLHLSKYIGLNQALAELPKYLVEAVLFSIAVLFASYVMSNGLEYFTIESVSVFAAAGFKALPHIQQMFRSISVARGNMSCLEPILEILSVPTNEPLGYGFPNCSVSGKKQLLVEELQYINPSAKDRLFTFPSFSVAQGECVYITGPSGSGKSTLFDLLIGLRKAVRGSVKIVSDDTSRLASINDISIATQHAYIFDGSLKDNICLQDSKSFDDYRFKRCIVIAGLSEIYRQRKDTPLSKATVSGGEAQRIGIARALYRNSLCLLLDEPFSAIPRELEQALLDRLTKACKRRILLIISHTNIRASNAKEIQL